MSVLQSLRVLARYNLLTPVAVLGVLAAGPTLAADKLNAAGTELNTAQTIDTDSGYTNKGTIAVTSGIGVNATSATTFFINTGRISSTGSYGVAFSGGDLGRFYNSGTISGATGYAGATFNNPVGSFLNDVGGTISGDGAGIYAAGATSGTFENRGTISSADTGFLSISSSALTIVNSGTIKGGNKAIKFAATNDRLSILTGSQLFGVADFGGGADTFDFSGFYGTAVVTTTGLENVVSGDRAFVASGGNTTITIYDQTGATSMGSVTSSAVGSVQTAIANELGGFSAGNILDSGSLSGYAASPRQTSAEGAANQAVFSELDVGDASRGKAWGSVFGGFSADSAPVSQSNVYGGIVAGTHYQLDAQTRLGGLLGYSRSSFNVGDGQQVIDSNTGVVGVYGKTDLGMIELNYALLGGGSSHSSSRKVVVGAALENVTASFASWSINPSLGISIPVMSDDTTQIKVAASGSYIYGGVGGYTETSANFSAAVGAMPISVFEARLELNGEKIVGQTDHGTVRMRGKAGVLAQVNAGSSNIPLTLNGTATSFGNPGSTTLGAYAGAGLSADIGSGLVLDVGFDASIRNDGTTSAAAKAGLVGSF